MIDDEKRLASSSDMVNNTLNSVERDPGFKSIAAIYSCINLASYLHSSVLNFLIYKMEPILNTSLTGFFCYG